jgi:hypothetical protein
MQMMRIAKDVEEELREEDDEGNRPFVRKNLGRTESSGFGSKYRSGLSLAQKDISKSANTFVNTGWSNPARKPEPSGSHSNSNSSMNSTGRKISGDRRNSTTERWRGMRIEETEELRAKGLCFKCKGKWHPTQHKCPEGSLRILILGAGETINDDGEIVSLEIDDSDVEEEIEAENAFLLLKKIMTSPPVLILPNFSLPFEVECDASGRGIGAVLMQQRQPVAFFSKALSDGNLAKSVYEKELMALVLCIQHWRHYLLGKEFIVYTDHKSLKHFLQQKVTSPDQQCWLAKLLGYQFEVKYKPRLENKAADALSRCYDDGELSSIISYPMWDEKQKLLEEIAADEYIKKLK